MTGIRKATVADLNHVAELFDEYRVFYDKKPDIEKAKSFIADRLKLEDSVIFLAETDEKKIAGFVQLYPLFSSTRMQRLWLLNDLFIDQKYRGKGLSKQLIEVSKELCKQTNSCGLILETAKTNAVGNALYPKAGFSLDDAHNYYTWDNC